MSGLAVVTGASSGIGLELARLFIADGFEVISVAEDENPEIGKPIRADLATPEGVEDVAAQLRALPIDALCLNAGIGAGGAFVTDTLLEDELRLIDLNVRSTVHLAKLLLPPMVARRQGRVLFTSSIAATQPGTFHAVYNASKSFVQSFALALREELNDSGVTVTSLMPGPTDTEFFERAGLEDTRIGQAEKDDPADVAREGYEALMEGKAKVVAASLKSKVQGRTGRFVPDTAKAKMHGKLAERKE